MKKILSVLIIIILLIGLSITASAVVVVPEDILTNPRTLENYNHWVYFPLYTVWDDLEAVKSEYYIASDKPFTINIELTEGGWTTNIFPSYGTSKWLYGEVTRDWNYTGTKIHETKNFYDRGNNWNACNIGKDFKSNPKFLNVDYEMVQPLTNGDVVVSSNGLPPPATLEPIMKDWAIGVKVLSPHNGFKQSQIDQVGITYGFKVPCPIDATIDNIKLKVDGFITGSGEVESGDFEIINGYAYGLYRVTGRTGFGEKRELKVNVTDFYGKVWSSKVIVSCFEGFVDDDGDGFDDRGDDDYWVENPYNQPPDIDNSDLLGIINSIKGFFEGLWGIIPEPIYVVLIGGITILIAVGILRAVL